MLRLFEKFGIELEYMIVRKEDFRVAPIADKLITDFRGAPLNECEVGACGLSNELAAHVIELKTPVPSCDFAQMEERFMSAIGMVDSRLSRRGARLLPGPMHPTMDPARESFTWPHEGREIYSLYDRIFDCHGHGWFNLQSCHINLPFADDREFALLHSAIILLLPLMPAITAGSPFKDGAVSGLADTRLEIYERNQARFPSITGRVIPEPVFSRSEYEKTILQPMYREVGPLDPEGVICHEWLNSRGAIARFERNAIEIRLLDVQECPAADLAIAQFLISALRELLARHGSDIHKLALHSCGRARRRQLHEVIKSGLAAPILLKEIREAYNLPGPIESAGGFWRHVLDSAERSIPPVAGAIVRKILDEGNLSKRLLDAYERNPGPDAFPALMASLATCLSENRMFDPLDVSRQFRNSH